MAAAVVTFARQSASPDRLVYLCTSDGGEVAATTLANATLVSRTTGAGNTPGPLLSALSAAYASQAAAQAVFGGGSVGLSIQARTLSNNWLVNANVSSSLPVLEVSPPDDVAAVALLTAQYQHSFTA